MQHPEVARPPDQNRFLTNMNEEETNEKTTHLLEEILGRKLKGLTFAGSKPQDRILGQSGISAEANGTNNNLFNHKSKYRGLFSHGAVSKDAEITSLGLGNPKQSNLKDSLESTKKETAASKEKQTENITNLTGNRSDKMSDGFEFRIKRVPSREESEYLSNSADKNAGKNDTQTEQFDNQNGPPDLLNPERALHFSVRSSELRRSLTESQAQVKSNKVTPNPKPQKQANQTATQFAYPKKARNFSQLESYLHPEKPDNRDQKETGQAVESFQELIPKGQNSRGNVIEELSVEQSHSRQPSISGGLADLSPQDAPTSSLVPDRGEERQNFPSAGRKNTPKHSTKAVEGQSGPDYNKFGHQGSLVLREPSEEWPLEGRGSEPPSGQKKSQADLPQNKKGILTNKNKMVGRASANASVYDLAHMQNRPVPPSQAPNRQSSDRVRFHDKPTVWVVQSYKTFLKQDDTKAEKKCCRCQLI